MPWKFYFPIRDWSELRCCMKAHSLSKAALEWMESQILLPPRLEMCTILSVRLAPDALSHAPRVLLGLRLIMGTRWWKSLLNTSARSFIFKWIMCNFWKFELSNTPDRKFPFRWRNVQLPALKENLPQSSRCSVQRPGQCLWEEHAEQQEQEEPGRLSGFHLCTSKGGVTSSFPPTDLSCSVILGAQQMLKTLAQSSGKVFYLLQKPLNCNSYYFLNEEDFSWWRALE